MLGEPECLGDLKPGRLESSIIKDSNESGERHGRLVGDAQWMQEQIS